ncbi:phage tail tape measure C-terminal domain-containing protein [Albibacillus kandeliae]|uniref:phage tail tape measure C-terminal domain-containing protein n=1 Tax=Albibacillus kandeliae TaxID=2174228 RepID=UPI000D692E37|nr:phage tail tape measure C-terminal domain-containing protein [Albibacillus kandeliae]
MREKRFSVRFAAVGGAQLQAEFRGIGVSGQEALKSVTDAAYVTSAGLEAVEVKALQARQRHEEMAVAAARGAAGMRSSAVAASGLADQINRMVGVSPAIGQSTAEYLRQGQALDDLRAKFNPVFSVIRQYRSEVSEIRSAHLEGALSADEMAAAISRARTASLNSIAAFKGQTRTVQQLSTATRATSFRMQQLFYQVNDIGVSLAGGMNPLLVLAQQGTQIAQIYGAGNGGLGGLFKDLGRVVGGVVTRFAPLAVAVGLGSVAVAGLTHEINDAQKVTVGFGDTALAVFQVIGRGIRDWIKPAVDAISGWFSTVWDEVVEGVVWAGNGVIKGIQLVVEDIKYAITVVPSAFDSAWQKAKGYVFYALNDMTSGLYKFLEEVTSGLNSVFGTSLAAPQGLNSASTYFNEVGNDAMVASDAATKRYAEGLQAYRDRQNAILNSDPLGEFYTSVQGQAVKNAKNRKDEDAKGGQKDQVDALVKSLKNELAVLRETDPIKKQMLEYADKLTGATDAQKKQVRDLVIELDKEKNGWGAVTRALAEYAEDAKRVGSDIGDALVGGFKSAEGAFREFVSTGKTDFKSLIQSMVADLAVLKFRQTILGPVADFLSGGGLSNAVASLFHSGGVVGAGGSPRSVPAELFLGAKRYHSGGDVLAHDEVPAILQTGERVLSRSEVARGASQGGVTRVLIDLGEGLVATILEQANNTAVQISQSGFSQFSRDVLPVRVQEINKNPRRR